MQILSRIMQTIDQATFRARATVSRSEGAPRC